MYHLILAHKKNFSNSKIAVINETGYDEEMTKLSNISIRNLWKVCEPEYIVDNIIDVSNEELLNILHNNETIDDNSMIKFKPVKSFYGYINNKFKEQINVK